MPLWLLSGLLGIRKALAAVFSLVLRYPWQAACIALVLFAGWQMHSLHRAHAALSECERRSKADRASYVAAQQEALRRAVAAKEAQEADYRAKAERNKHERDQAVADASSAERRYADANRVRRPAPSSPSRPAPSASGDSNPGLPEGVSPDTLVAISDSDLHTCTIDAVNAVKAHEWALSLGK